MRACLLFSGYYIKIPLYMDVLLPNLFFSTTILDLFPNGKIFIGFGWTNGEGLISNLKTIQNIPSFEECMDKCASNRKSNGQGCVAFTFVKAISKFE